MSVEFTSSSTVGLETINGIPLVGIVGDVDIANVDLVYQALNNARHQNAGIVVVTLEKATYFDSAAIGAIIKNRALLAKSGQQLLIVRPVSYGGRRILEIAGLSDASAFDSLSDALDRAKRSVIDRRGRAD